MAEKYILDLLLRVWRKDFILFRVDSKMWSAIRKTLYARHTSRSTRVSEGSSELDVVSTNVQRVTKVFERLHSQFLMNEVRTWKGLVVRDNDKERSNYVIT